MLKFQLDHSTSQLRWCWSNGRWVSGSSWIEPYLHPLLEHYAITDGRSTMLVARERQAALPTDLVPVEAGPQMVDASAYARRVDEVRRWPLEFLSIRRELDGSYHLRAGQWGTAPVYVVEAHGQVHGSWNLPDLRDHVSADRLDELGVTRILVDRQRYTRETPFRGIYQLTERAGADYSPTNGLTIRYPEPATHALPRELRPDIDVIRVYQSELNRAVGMWPYVSQETAVELSGGLDSSNVAMTLAQRNNKQILAYALIYGGAIGRQQVSRRREMIKYGRFDDMRVDALDFPPLMPLGARAQGDPICPLAEPYHEAVERLLEEAHARGIRTVFTGDGGDELLSLRGDEWAGTGKIRSRFNPNRNPPPWLGSKAVELVDHVDHDLAPATVVNEASLLGFACRTPQFIHTGMWPLSPLCSPRLIRFSEQLPIEWRLGKRLCRERLRHLGFSDEVIDPPLRENFRHVMEHGLREYGMPLVMKVLEDSMLVDLGYVDGAGLRAAHDRVAEGGEVDTSIFAFIRMELGLRGLLA